MVASGLVNGDFGVVGMIKSMFPVIMFTVVFISVYLLRRNPWVRRWALLDFLQGLRVTLWEFFIPEGTEEREEPRDRQTQ